MYKRMWTMALGLVLIWGIGVWAQDTNNDSGHKVNWDSGSKGKDGAKSDVSGGINTNTSKDAVKRDKWGNEIKASCPHGDFSQFNYELSPEQKARLKEDMDKIDQKTKGYNWIVRDHYKKIMECEKGSNSQDYYDAWKQVNRIEKVINDAHAELERVRLSILTVEQSNLEQMKKKALDDHFRNCVIHRKSDHCCNDNCHHTEKCEFPYDYLWKQAENYGVFNASDLLKSNVPKPEACCDDMKGKDSHSKDGDDWKAKKSDDGQK